MNKWWIASRAWKHNFKWPFMYRLQLNSFVWSSMIETLMLQFRKLVIFNFNFSRELSKWNTFKPRKITISYKLFIKYQFQGYRFEMGIAIFAKRVPWNFAYSPFKLKFKLRLLSLYYFYFFLCASLRYTLESFPGFPSIKNN